MLSSHKIKEAILKTLDEKQLNIYALEKEAGVAKNVIRNIISGQSLNPSIDTCILIAKALDCTLDELIGLKDLNSKNSTISKNPTTFNKKLFNEIISLIISYIEEKDYSPSFEELLSFINEAYLFSMLKNDAKPDLKLVKWIVDKRLLQIF